MKKKNNKLKFQIVKEYISTSESAKYLNISIQAIYQAVRRGSLKLYKISEHYVLKFKDVEKYKLLRKVGRPKEYQLKIKF